ncbi:MAG: type II secretion system GspH family protein [Planctomycetota bacterium]|nr:type II secretion system protein [Planctomycetaceae bacterium]MDQ3330416.1 type II secretion system GspH family protein [Planctomycetota bacterium]
MTLIELMIAASVMSLVAVVLGGLVHAVDTARTHVEGMQEASAQGRFAVDRIRAAVERSGTYRIGTGATVAGVAVVWNADQPEILVVWTGGREDSRAHQSPLNRLPRANELIIYAPDPNAPQRLVEIVVPSATGSIDFDDSGFATRIRQIINSSTSDERVPLCDRVRIATKDSTTVAALRFEIEATPAKELIASTATGTHAWRDLAWHGGVSTNSSGLRRILIRVEIQVLTQGTPGDTTSDVSLPVFGAASRRYVYRKG